MAEPETPLQMARRRVASQQTLFESQWALIRRMQHADLPADREMEVLATLEGKLELLRWDLDRLSRPD